MSQDSSIPESELFGANSDYLETLYDQFRSDPAKVPAEWATRFEQWRTDDDARINGKSHRVMLQRMAPHAHAAMAEAAPQAFYSGIEFPSRALYLIHAYRVHGHLHANLDPLQLYQPRPSPELELSYYGLSEADLQTEFPTGDLSGSRQRKLGEIIGLLKRTYCGSIGPEFMHITDSARKHWLQERLESVASTPDYDADTRKHIFGRIMHAEEFERFLHTRYAGQKRFSLEGGESLIPMLDALVQRAGSFGTKEIIIGMAHRGRLNVLANIMGKSLSDIFSEFEGAHFEEAAQGQGDVKYHLGFSSDVRTPGGVVHLSLGFNPSHLEAITPVVLGSVRARQCRRGDKARHEVIPVLMHGDAAFAGQGVVAESLNLSKLRGFKVGGAIHIVINNQIGFTVNPFDARSTVYATDIAKMVQAPILHVNGDDPEACCLATEIAVEYRNHFHEDIVIDLVCYRRHGHNEADSPEVTQPVMYRKISEHPTVEHVYRDYLTRDGILSKAEAEAMVEDYRNRMEEVRRAKDRPPPTRVNSLQGRWEGFLPNDPVEPATGVAVESLQSVVRAVHRLPADFSLHPKIEKIYESRIQMMDGNEPVDWGCAETMAYATLVHEGGWVRLSGQDSGRGTFFHRHAVVYDQKNGKSMIPLRQVENGELSHFIVVDSMLSEMAVMAFEYGYSIAEPRALVVWEAQYGDFANNAQGIIDQFIVAGESKWSRMSGLVLWLPHGYEGQGAEHSSARLERYLQLCAEHNLQVTYPTTPAQLFHLLRRQVMIRTRKPLVIMAPKSMLRQKLSFSSRDELIAGGFRPVIDETDAAIQPSRTRRLILCSGKVYFDLLAARQEAGITDVAFVRIERLYPFPYDELKQVTAQFAATNEIVWLQEEPENQGAWFQIEHCIERCLHAGQQLHHLARPAAAAPAVGSAKRHAREQQALIDAALAGGKIKGGEHGRH
ncbi:MAG TPA: 2-oxoglutarate dehydrogenase E1 component [Mariprofundaceae bacterium]|nr:2-oxoglutarate dehydrogenase E1 component [Mariprofundaceae bacterium]